MFAAVLDVMCPRIGKCSTEVHTCGAGGDSEDVLWRGLQLYS